MNVLKRAGLIVIIMAAVVWAGGCAADRESGPEYRFGRINRPVQVGVVLSAPGKSVPGNNEAVVAGIKKLSADLDAEYKILSPGDLVDNEESLSYLAENNYDLVVAVGPRMAEELDRLAANYPDIKFVIFDGDVDRPNVASVRIIEDDGAFLAGVEAALLTKADVVGFVGGAMLSDKQTENSFVRGVQYINATDGRKIKVNVAYVGLTEMTAMNPEKAKSMASAMYAAGTDVIFCSALGAQNGVAAAAAENKRTAIVGDVRLMNASPWSVPGSIVKKPQNVIYDVAKNILTGKFTAGRHGYGLPRGGLDFAVSGAVAPETAARMNLVKDRLQRGIIQPYSIQIPQDTVLQFSPPAQPGTGPSGNNMSSPPVSSGTPSSGAESTT